MKMKVKKDPQEEEGLQNKSGSSAIAMFRISKSNRLANQSMHNQSVNTSTANEQIETPSHPENNTSISIGTTTNNLASNDDNVSSLSHTNRIGTIVSKRERNTATAINTNIEYNKNL